MKALEIQSNFNDLEKYVTEWINERAVDYDDGVEGVLMDLSHGCASGYVSELIYTKDCNAFYNEHADDIDQLLKDWNDKVGEHPLTNYNFDVGLRNWLAWFAFEETANRICNQAGVYI